MTAVSPDQLAKALRENTDRALPDEVRRQRSPLDWPGEATQLLGLPLVKS